MHGKTPTEIPGNGKTRRLYPSDEARELLGGISVATFRRLTGSGELKVVRQGRKVYVEPAEIEAYIERCRDAA